MTDTEKPADEQPADELPRAAVDDVESDAVAPAPSLEEELAGANDRALRLQAEMENVRKRMWREMEDVRKYAALPLMQDLLGVADNLDRAIESAEQTEEGAAGSSLLDGVRMVAGQLEQALVQRQCKKIETVGQPFDPNFHEALGQQPSAEYEPGTVAMEVRSGYKLHDRVVRPAQVFIAAPE